MTLTSGNKTEPMGTATFDIKLGTLKLKHIFVVCKYWTLYLILGIDFHHNLELVQIETKMEHCFSTEMFNWSFARPSHSVSNIQSITY